MASSTLKVIGFFCLFVLSIYSVYFIDNKNLAWLALAGWGAVISYWWFEDRDARKAREEKRSELSSFVADLERRIGALQRTSPRDETWK
jgi:hypothetical protein